MSEHPIIMALRRASGRQQEERPLPTYEAQLRTSREIQFKTAAPHTFRRGDIVRYISPTGPHPADFNAAVCMMFWRLVDFETEDDKTRGRTINGDVLGHLDRIDCVVMIFDGQAVHFHCSSTVLLELDPRGK